jgi:SAM-dependent methyltransferase
MTMDQYDRVYYHTAPYRRSHPLHLSTVAALFGMTPRNPAAAAVLEVGCGDGSNLIPMAASLPGGRFVGIDRSQRQIDAGLRTVDTLGLHNINLICGDITAISVPTASFDYVIAHGVLSWVPPHVRHALFRLAQTTLTEDGILFVSHNAMPGWGVRRTFRDATRWYAAQTGEAEAAAARTLLDLFSRTMVSEDGYDPAFLRSEAGNLAGLPEWYLFHDLLEETNDPLYFHEVSSLARTYGLRFLADADLSKRSATDLPPETAPTFAPFAGDRERYEQLMDLFRMRMFRNSVFCRQDQRTRDEPYRALLYSASFATPVRPAGEGTPPNSPESVRFVHPNGGAISAFTPPLRAALVRLGEVWPGWRRWDDLREDISRAPYGITLDAQQSSLLAGQLLSCIFANLVDMSFYPPPSIATSVRECPEVFAPARHLGLAGRLVPTLRHESISLSEVERRVAFLCDGTHTLDALQRTDPSQSAVRAALERFRDAALLVATD